MTIHEGDDVWLVVHDVFEHKWIKSQGEVLTVDGKHISILWYAPNGGSHIIKRRHNHVSLTERAPLMVRLRQFLCCHFGIGVDD